MLATVREKQFVDTTGGEADADVVAVAEAGGVIAVNLTMIRGGRHLGDRSFFPQHGEGATLAEALEAFIAQHYLEHPVPARILVSEAIETDALEALLSEQAGKKVTLLHRVTGERKVWIGMAQANARLSAARRSADRANQSQRLAALRDTLDLPQLNRIECFDISHTMGEATVASCVVYEGDDLKKSDYRRYNIGGITPGDDYAAMRDALIKRFRKSVEENGVLPDLLLIDGGKGQISSAVEVMAELGLGDVYAARRRQGRGAQARPGNADLRRRPRTEARQGPPRLSPDPAGARRSAPLRHHRPPRQTRQGTPAVDPGRHRRNRPQAPQTAAGTLRRIAGRARRRRRRACHGERYQSRIGGNHLQRPPLTLMPLNLPNLLTWLRILFIPLMAGVFYLPDGWVTPYEANLLAAAFFGVAALTDWLDGYLARALDQTSAFGAFLDPVADKLMVAAALIVLIDIDRVAPLIGLIIIGREITISALREWMAKEGKSASVAVSFVGKLKTTAQMIAIVLLLYFDPVAGLPIASIGTLLIWVAALLTLVSMAYYLVMAARALQKTS